MTDRIAQALAVKKALNRADKYLKKGEIPPAIDELREALHYAEFDAALMQKIQATVDRLEKLLQGRP